LMAIELLCAGSAHETKGVERWADLKQVSQAAS
jgi:hypothetical protein